MDKNQSAIKDSWFVKAGPECIAIRIYKSQILYKQIFLSSFGMLTFPRFFKGSQDFVFSAVIWMFFVRQNKSGNIFIVLFFKSNIL